MHVSRISLLALSATIALVCAPGAQAKTTTVHFCDDPGGTTPLPAGASWGTRVEGDTASSDGRRPAASLTCINVVGRALTMFGPGGYSAQVTPGTIALVTFTPPPGYTIVAVNAKRQVLVDGGGYTEAAVYTSTGRVLGEDPQPWTTSKDVVGEPVTFDVASLGPDGAQGLSWGLRCPATVPAPRTDCGGGIFALTGTITISDGLPEPTPAPTAEPSLLPSPTVAPTPVPSSTPFAQPKATVSLKTKRKSRSIVLSGSAVGCASVKLSLPGKRSLSVAVRKGAWKTTVKYRTGRYTAACGKATATATRRVG